MLIRGELRLNDRQIRTGAVSAPLVIGLFWACAVLPGLSVRSFIWEEATNVEIARDILARGDLLQPSIYGLVWNEKPSLLPWLIAVVAALSGQVNEWAARLPAMLSTLFTALLVQGLTRRYATWAASVFAGLSFLFCPLLLQKLTIAEPDTLITFLSFAAFVLWWNGAERNELTILRWIGCGLLLATVAMAKGPQPVGFFSLGVVAYVINTRRWRDFPGLLLCLLLPFAATLAWAAAVYQPGLGRVWLVYMRMGGGFSWFGYLLSNVKATLNLVFELLPSLILLPHVPSPWARVQRPAAPVVEPLVLYSIICTAALLIWPGAKSRYAMPIAPAVAVLAGIAWNSLGEKRNIRVRNLASGLVAGLIAYQLVLVIAIMPLFADRFGASRLAGKTIETAIRADPAPVFCKSRRMTQPDTNQLSQLSYIRIPIRCLTQDEMTTLVPPAWLVTSDEVLTRFRQLRPDLDVHDVVRTASIPPLIAARLNKRSANLDPAPTK
jgi:4-amino-4-deoxy-L-arabinose transferase-like glycosyltransferase